MMVDFLIALIAALAGAAIGYLLAVNRKNEECASLRSERDVLKEKLGAATLLEERLKHLAEGLTTASEEILSKREQQLKRSNVEQMSAILTPLRENIAQMRQAVERNGQNQVTTMKLLDERIRQNMEMAKLVGEHADQLARALTAENKLQGNFGELKLKQLLDDMDFVEGEQYVLQKAVEGEGGATLIPDVVLRFPDHRDVVIDSKVSLKAYLDYHNAADENARKEALHRHLASVKGHIKELAKKDYSRYTEKGHTRLDFVFMYIFSENALQLAIAAEPELTRQAYEQGIILAGSQSLFLMLRLLELSWKQMQQFENQQEIMATANEIVKRVQIYYKRVEEVDAQLAKTQKAFKDLRNITRSDGQSIVTSAHKLLKYGARQAAGHTPLPPPAGEAE